MLRTIFGEPPRKDEGALLAANQTIKKYLNMLSLVPPDRQTTQERRFIIWSHSFLRALDELEQSQYAAEQYGRRVHTRYVDEMAAEEADDYYRHLYYYKNALVRLFAVLDKLGHFLNERFELNTERFKSRYSYFTVLRNMHQNRIHTDLEIMLYDLKTHYKGPVAELRNQRNMEIHTISADLLDDLMKAAESKYGDAGIRPTADDVQKNLAFLRQGTEMTFRSVETVFAYLTRKVNRGRPQSQQGH